MFTSGFNRVLFAFLIVFSVTACSKNAEIEGLLESYYRAAAKGDTENISELIDTRMFTITTSSHRSALRSKVQQLLAYMNELSNANGELKKIDITQLEEFKNNDETFQKVKFNLVFKNDRTITQQEIISRVDGKAQIYWVNEWADAERILYGY